MMGEVAGVHPAGRVSGLRASAVRFGPIRPSGDGAFVRRRASGEAIRVPRVASLGGSLRRSEVGAVRVLETKKKNTW